MAAPQYGGPPQQPPMGFGGYGGTSTLTPCDTGKRVIAAVIDSLIASGIAIAGWVIFFLLAAITRFGLLGMLGFVVYVAAFLYKPYFEVTKDGQTIGKKMQGIKVVKSDGSPIDWGAALIRELILTFLGIIELVVVLVNNGIRVGDMAAKTIVIDAGAVPAAAGYGGGYQATPAAPARPPTAPAPQAMPPTAPAPQAMPPTAPAPQAMPPTAPAAPPPAAPPPAAPPPAAPPPAAPPPAAPPQG